MAARGPRPDPSSARSAHGRNTLRRPIKKASGPIAPPARVAARPAAAAFWSAHADALTACGRLRPELSEPFAMLCELHAECLELAAAVAAEGWEDSGEVNPKARLLRDWRRDFLAAARDFGLTPASDTRLPQDATDGQKEIDPEAALLARLKVRRA